MRVLHIGPAYPPFLGGAETYMHGLSARLVAAGHDVEVVTTHASKSAHFRLGTPTQEVTRGIFDGVSVTRVPVAPTRPVPQAFDLVHWISRVLDVAHPRLGSLLTRRLPSVPKLRDVLCNIGSFDIIHAVNLHYPSLALWASEEALHRRVPLVLTPFAHLDGGIGFPRAILRRARMVFTQSERESEALQTLAVPRGRLVSCGVGVDADSLHTGDGTRLRTRLGIGTTPIVAFVGNASANKGAYTLLRAMKLLWAAGERAVLVVAGTAETALKRQFSATQGVIYLDVVSDQVKRDLLAAATLLAMPSRVESLGVAYLEAWANGLPVIGARSGATPDLISPGVNGLLVPFGDAPALAGAIAFLVRDEDVRVALGRRGRELVKSRFVWEKVVPCILSAYNQAVAG